MRFSLGAIPKISGCVTLMHLMHFPVTKLYIYVKQLLVVQNNHQLWKPETHTVSMICVLSRLDKVLIIKYWRSFCNMTLDSPTRGGASKDDLRYHFHGKTMSDFNPFCKLLNYIKFTMITTYVIKKNKKKKQGPDSYQVKLRCVEVYC